MLKKENKVEGTKIISVGGSIIAPDQPSETMLIEFVSMITDWLSQDDSRRLILIAGGGGPARTYQAAFYHVMSGLGQEISNMAADWIGVAATRLNAELLRACFGSELASEPVVTNPLEAPQSWRGKILVAAGWKPGFSSDNDAVLLAERYGARQVINLSNIEKIYTADPKTDPTASPLDSISWADFCQMVGSEWRPGLNAPFDPIASKKAAALGLTVICAKGTDVKNTRAILDGAAFVGTTIS